MLKNVINNSNLKEVLNNTIKKVNKNNKKENENITTPIKSYTNKKSSIHPINPKITKSKNIEIKRVNPHFKPRSIPDGIAYCSVKFLRTFADLYFQKNYVYRAIALETVAAIPGMVGGLYRHLYSLRNMKDNGKIIKKLLDEAENERQHLLAFIDVGKPRFLDILLIKGIQPIFFSFYMMFYGLFPKTAHRFVGYLEEEAVRSYDCFEDEILKGNIKNVGIGEGAIKYWNMEKDAKLIDLVRVVRADEERHRDANHGMADVKPFPLG